MRCFEVFAYTHTYTHTHTYTRIHIDTHIHTLTHLHTHNTQTQLVSIDDKLSELDADRKELAEYQVCVCACVWNYDFIGMVAYIFSWKLYRGHSGLLWTFAADENNIDIHTYTRMQN